MADLHPLVWAEIHADALQNNYHYLNNLHQHTKVAPVLKSNAYGHGLVEVARILDPLQPPFFCVHSLEEALALRRARITTPILIMGYVDPHNLRQEQLPFQFAIWSKEQMEAIHAYQPHAQVHLFADTGLSREGITVDNLPQLLSLLQHFPRLRIVGLMSHLAIGDQPSHPLTRQQIARFTEAQSLIWQAGIKLQWKHISASGGHLNLSKRTGIANLSRTGIALYGINPGNKTSHLQPALSLHTRIVHIQQLFPGQPVGYDATYIAQQPTTIGLLPLGYNDGAHRQLSNIGYVIVSGKNCRILGRVSMNYSIIDLTGVPHAVIGQVVTVYSGRAKAPNCIVAAARQCHTIPHQLLVNIPSTIPRTISSIALT